MLLDNDAAPQVDNVAPFERRKSVTEETHEVMGSAIEAESNNAVVERSFVEKRQDQMETELEIPKEETRALNLHVRNEARVETAMREMNINSEYRHEIDEMAIEEDERTLSTRDSRSPSVTPPSSIRVPGETYHSPIPRQVAFDESTKTPTSPAQRAPSLPSLEERISHAVDNPFNHDSMIIDFSHISNPFLGEKTFRTPPRGPALLMHDQKNPHAIRPTHELSPPATVLLTNTYDEWSNFCVGLGGDGNIDLVDSRLHGRAKPPIVWSNEYTMSSAINGAWISPGELALVHKDARKNDDKCQISLIKYAEPQSSRKPEIINLTRSPHAFKNKITAIAPLWVTAGRRTFATGGNSSLMNKIHE